MFVDRRFVATRSASAERIAIYPNSSEADRRDRLNRFVSTAVHNTVNTGPIAARDRTNSPSLVPRTTTQNQIVLLLSDIRNAKIYSGKNIAAIVATASNIVSSVPTSAAPRV